jgi:hypothetical protein
MWVEFLHYECTPAWDENTEVIAENSALQNYVDTSGTISLNYVQLKKIFLL